MILSPSLLSADVGNLAAELSALEAAGVQWAHWDVMDGRFGRYAPAAAFFLTCIS